MKIRARVLAVAVTASVTTLNAAHALSSRITDDEHLVKARATIAKAVQFLKSKQDKATGGWNVPVQPAGAPGPGQPAYPAVTGLVINGLISGGGLTSDDPAVASGVKYILGFVQPDGAIYDRVLPSYNTSIVLSALSKVNTPQAKAAIPGAQDFLRKTQWSEASVQSTGPDAPQQVTKENQFYGGMGYGKHGRPDLSNLATALQGLHDSGVSADDETFKRAVTFLQRVQMLGSVNDMPYAKGSKQGGFIYATVANSQSVEGKAGQTYAGEIEETLDDGTKVSRLRCYGSMSYAGFKSYVYADLPRDDIRVKAAYDWVRSNYTVEENPGMKTEGLYYYFVTMARALHAWGQPRAGEKAMGPTIHVIGVGGKEANRNWADDLIDRLAGLQNEDGSFKVVNKRWMEDNDVLVTAYALITLGEAVQAKESVGKE